MRRIESKKGLKEILNRIEKEQVQDKAEKDYWKLVVLGCINDTLALDEVDYANSPKWLKPLWKGLK